MAGPLEILLGRRQRGSLTLPGHHLGDPPEHDPLVARTVGLGLLAGGADHRPQFGQRLGPAPALDGVEVGRRQLVQRQHVADRGVLHACQRRPLLIGGGVHATCDRTVDRQGVPVEQGGWAGVVVTRHPAGRGDAIDGADVGRCLGAGGAVDGEHGADDGGQRQQHRDPGFGVHRCCHTSRGQTRASHGRQRALRRLRSQSTQVELPAGRGLRLAICWRGWT